MLFYTQQSSLCASLRLHKRGFKSLRSLLPYSYTASYLHATLTHYIIHIIPLGSFQLSEYFYHMSRQLPFRVLCLSAVAALSHGSGHVAACRDRFLEPFASTSIWNTAIGCK